MVILDPTSIHSFIITHLVFEKKNRDYVNANSSKLKNYLEGLLIPESSYDIS